MLVRLPYLVYWPVMRLREPTGTSHAEVVAVYSQCRRYDGSARASSICEWVFGLRELHPGLPWSNDLVMVNLTARRCRRPAVGRVPCGIRRESWVSST